MESRGTIPYGLVKEEIEFDFTTTKDTNNKMSNFFDFFICNTSFFLINVIISSKKDMKMDTLVLNVRTKVSIFYF